MELRNGQRRRLAQEDVGAEPREELEQLIGIAPLVEQIRAEHERPRRLPDERLRVVPAHTFGTKSDPVSSGVQPQQLDRIVRPVRREHIGAGERGGEGRQPEPGAELENPGAAEVEAADRPRERDAARPELGPVRQEFLLVERLLVDQLVGAGGTQQRQRVSGEPDGFFYETGSHGSSVTDMRYRQLGSSDLQVSEISLGSWLTYGGGVEREQAEACVAKAFDVGINFIDTANVYAGGKAEEFLGEVLSGRPRDSYILATKLFFRMSDTDQGLSRAQVFKQIDASLARLRTDHVDLYQCHRYDKATPLEETMEALNEVVASGKAPHLPKRARRGGDDRRRPARRRRAGDDAGGARARHLDPAPPPRGRGLPALRGERDLADRVVAARAGRPHREVSAGAETAGG